MKRLNSNSESEILRQKAEKLVKLLPQRTVSSLSKVEALKIIHELDVHHIELELQNEELKLAIEQAESAANKYSKLYDLAPSGYFTLSREGTIIELNLHASKILGKIRSHVKNSQFGFFVSDDTKAIFNLFLEKVFASKTEVTCEVTLLNNESLPIIGHLTGIVSENGDQCLIALFDITARRQLELSVLQSEVRLALAVRAGGVGVWDYDVVNNKLLWDDQMFNLYGVDKDFFGGGYEAWRKGIHPDDAARCDLEHQMALCDEKEYNTEFRIRLPNGTIRYIRALGIVQRDDSGKPLHMIGTNWDITAQKNTEKALLQSKEKLQKINAEKDKFFSIIAHDLRSPLQPLLGYTHMMVEELPTLTPDQTQRMALNMRNAAAKLFSLLENLLEWSRLQRGLTSFKPEPFILMPIIAQSMYPVMDSANVKEIEIIYAIPADLEVFADDYMLSSIIRNLTSNAVKFTHKGGKVTIAAKSVNSHSVKISVKDTGIGMSPEIVNDLFRLDVQSNRRGTDNEPSVGLGLIICQDFIEKHGGKIWVESEVGKGSVFYFTLPSHA
jgi:signal transduction histidine kinase